MNARRDKKEEDGAGGCGGGVTGGVVRGVVRSHDDER